MSLAALAQAAAWAFGGLAAIGILYLLLSAACVLRYGRRPAPRPSGRHPAVTLLKPLHGAEPGLAETLTLSLRQGYPGPVRTIFGVQRTDDPAIAVVQELIRRHPDRDIRLVVDPRQHGQNRKVSNLINMAREAEGEILVLADSDMRVGPTYLASLVAALEAPGIGGVTCLYHGVPTRSGWSRLAAAGLDTHFLPGVVVGLSLGLAHPCMGSTIALRRETLDALGGFEAIKDELADDYELGARIRAQGLALAVPPFVLGHVCPERRLREVIRQELRWIRTVRQIDPGGHAGSLVTHPVAYALLALILAPGPATVALAATSILARVFLALAVGRAFGVKPAPYRLVPVRDALSFALFVASFFGRGVSWRGHEFEVARSGALLPKPMMKARPDAT